MTRDIGSYLILKSTREKNSNVLTDVVQDRLLIPSRRDPASKDEISREIKPAALMYALNEAV